MWIVGYNTSGYLPEIFGGDGAETEPYETNSLENALRFYVEILMDSYEEPLPYGGNTDAMAEDILPELQRYCEYHAFVENIHYWIVYRLG